ncbi:MAG: 30S ribosomal protein S21 [Planctomycetota bacterium]|nr:30S ribosomal protein S21 [Planctomycetota bacterium]MDA1105168.1 30S ribosomal protein S21 [Planctomycetota bacterium]
MPIRVKSRGHESIEQMLRRFKKSCEKEGLTREVKDRQAYEKPSMVRRKAAKRRVALRLMALQPRPIREKFERPSR